MIHPCYRTAILHRSMVFANEKSHPMRIAPIGARYAYLSEHI
jgi:hypothetical protein